MKKGEVWTRKNPERPFTLIASDGAYEFKKVIIIDILGETVLIKGLDINNEDEVPIPRFMFIHIFEKVYERNNRKT